MNLVLLTRSDVQAAVGPEVALEAAREAFVSLSRGQAVSPAPFELLLPSLRGEVHAKGGYRLGDASLAIKVASGFAGVDGGPGSSQGVSLVFEAHTGRLTHLIADDGLLTALRTGAAGAIATDCLARADAERVLVVGSGDQARRQAVALLGIERRSHCTVEIWSRSRANAERCADDLSALSGHDVAVAADLERAVRTADIVITTTASTQALVAGEWVTPGTHVTSIGSDTPHKRELDTPLISRCDVLVVDSVALARDVGEIHWAVSEGEAAWVRVQELGAVLDGASPGRTHDRQRTLADLAGLGIQDAVVAEAAVRAARSRGLGAAIRLDVTTE